MQRNDLTTSQLYQRQIEIEKEMVDLGRDQFYENLEAANESGRGAETSYARSMVAQVTEGIVKAVKKNLDASRSMYVAPLRELNYNRAVVIALRTIFSRVSVVENNHSCTQVSTAIAIGEAIQLELKMQSLCDKSPQYMKEVQANWKSKRASSVKHKNNVVNSVIKSDEDIEWDHWATPVKLGVGGLLLKCICDNSDIFRLNKMYKRKRPIITVDFTESALEWIQKNNEFQSMLKPRYRPMLVQPNEWSQHTRPYLTDAVNSTLRFVRCKGRELNRFYKSGISPEMYRAISLAQSTPWRINKPVYNFLNELCAMKHPELIPEGEMEEKPPYPFEERIEVEDMTEEQKKLLIEWKSCVREIHSKDVKRRSNRTRTQMVLAIAKDYLNYDEFYFPHSIDTRGRIYSIPTVLQPQGDDICKGLLEFGRGEPLTSEGVYQLKLHIAGKYGLDKESHAVRIEWFDRHESEILAVAASPLDNMQWLLAADKPFQVLQSLTDYAKWKRDPNAVIHARVNKDGACNGLQHFSAMLRDGDVGDSVNLTPSTADDTPKSIYKVIAGETDTILNRNAMLGCTKAKQWLEFWRIYGKDGKVDYKCMKRPVMTLPYSATMFSRVGYIKEYIREKEAHTFFGTHFGECTGYLAKIVTEAMSTRIASATLILDWLVGACRDIMVEEDTVKWETPLNFTVCNRKDKVKGSKLKLFYEGKHVYFRYNKETDDPDISGMASAIAPNFVHSMDACHMLRLVRRCFDNNIKQLHLVHDDYGCHANHGGLLADLAKQEFYLMYEENDPIRQFYERYKDKIQTEPPEMIGSLNLENIIESTYAFD